MPAWGAFEQDEGTQFLPPGACLAWDRFGFSGGSALVNSQQSTLDTPLLPSSHRRISSGIFEASPAELGGAKPNIVALRGL